MNSFTQPRYGRFARIIWALAVVGRYKRINPDLNRPFFNLYLFRQQAGNRDIGFYRHTMKNILISRNHLYSVTPP